MTALAVIARARLPSVRPSFPHVLKPVGGEMFGFTRASGKRLWPAVAKVCGVWPSSGRRSSGRADGGVRDSCSTRNAPAAAVTQAAGSGGIKKRVQRRKPVSITEDTGQRQGVSARRDHVARRRAPRDFFRPAPEKRAIVGRNRPTAI